MSVQKYRRKSPTVEAVRWTGTNDDAIVEFINGNESRIENKLLHVYSDDGFIIMSEGQYLARDEKGQYHVWHAKFFEGEFESVV